MKKTLVVVVAVIAGIAIAGGQPRAEAPAAAKALHTPSMAQFMSAGYPLELVAAKKATATVRTICLGARSSYSRQNQKSSAPHNSVWAG